MPDWPNQLRYDPVGALEDCPDPAVRFFVRRDLHGRDAMDTRVLWELPRPARILARQAKDGSWTFRGARPNLERGQDYDQVETYRWMRHLVELYGFDRRHPAVERAAAWLLERQTGDGDFRGIYGRQYAPNYSGVITELLVKAGYRDEEAVERSFRWLLFMRQQDGGWAIPFRTAGGNLCSAAQRTILQPVREKPFSHLATGMVLRAFAAHPVHRRSEAARHAALLLAGRLMRRDAYPDRGSILHWQRPTVPFWFTDAVSALDTLSLLGTGPENAGVRRALDWIRAQQGRDGLFHFDMLAIATVPHPGHWASLAVCRILARLNGVRS